MTSPVGFWTTVLKPPVRPFGHCHLGSLEPVVTREDGTGEGRPGVTANILTKHFLTPFVGLFYTFKDNSIFLRIESYDL